MRLMGVLLVIGSLWMGETSVAAGTRARAAQRFTRCCVELAIPDVPPGPLCVQVRGRRPLGPRRACRLIGGKPIGQGDCSPAACRAPAA